MRTKFTLILLLLNVALFFYIFHARRTWPDPASLHKNPLGDSIANISTLSIGLGDAPPVKLARTGETWAITQPVNWPANPHAVDRILKALQFLEPATAPFSVAELAQHGQKLAEYGLDKPPATLAFTPAGTAAPVTLWLGAETADGRHVYLLSPDRRQIYLIGRELADSLRVDLGQLRDDELFTIKGFEVRTLSLQSAAAGAARVRLHRDGARWTFDSPIVTRASKGGAELAVNALNALRAGRFLTDREAPADRTGLDTPLLRVLLEGNNRRETLLVGLPVADAPPGEGGKDVTVHYARLEERAQLFTVAIPNPVLDLLDHAQETLRETRLLDFVPEAVTAITLTAPGQPVLTLNRLDAPAGGSSVWQFARTGDTGAPPQPADGGIIQHLLERLTLLAATSFFSDAPDSQQVESLGFNRPEREVTLTLASAAGGPGPTAAPARLTLQIGLGPGGEEFARVAGQTFIYAVPADTLGSLPVTARFYRDRLLRALPEGAQITGLTLAVQDNPAAPPVFSHQLAAGETWDKVLTTAPAAQQAALKALLVSQPDRPALLRTLRARQFVTDTFTEQVMVGGAVRPWKYRLDTTLALPGGAGAQTGATTLLLSERAGGAQFAGSREFNVDFEIEPALVDALWALTNPGPEPGPPPAAAETSKPQLPNSK